MHFELYFQEDVSIQIYIKIDQTMFIFWKIVLDIIQKYQRKLAQQDRGNSNFSYPEVFSVLHKSKVTPSKKVISRRHFYFSTEF